MKRAWIGLALAGFLMVGCVQGHVYYEQGNQLVEKRQWEQALEQYNKALPLIKAQLKALIARDLWDMNEYFQVMNATNKSVERALEILNDKEYEKILK